MNYAQEDQVQRTRERMEAPKRWALEQAEILQLIWEEFDASGHWPQASELQRELFGAGRRFSANEFGRQLPGSIGHLDVSKGVFTLTPLGLYYLHTPPLVLEQMTWLVRVLVERYATAGVEPEVNSAEFPELLGIDARQAQKLATVLMNDRFLFVPAGGTLDDGNQNFRADADSAIELREVRSIDDYFEAQNRIWYGVPRAGEIPQQSLDPAEFAAEAGTVDEIVSAESNVSDKIGSARLDGLHPMITEACSGLWEDGHRREAIGKAALAVRDSVRQLSGLEGLDGHQLMAQAFSPKDPRIVVADLRTGRGRDLQQGAHFIAMGAMAAIRNVHAHNLERLDDDEAWEQLAIFSYIARRLDDARDGPIEWQNTTQT